MSAPPPYNLESFEKGQPMPQSRGPSPLGYPPQQGCPPPEEGYPPPQGYPYQGGQYPPPQQGYSPPQHGYPPMQGYPPQGGQYYPPPQQQPYGQPLMQGQQTTIVIAAAGGAMQTSEYPVLTLCPHCRANITTSTEYVTGSLTWVLAILLLVFGCVLGCCLIPFFVNGCKDVVHSCPNCHQVLGRYKPMSQRTGYRTYRSWA